MPLIQDPAAIRQILETDRPWSAFALADLAPQHAPFCQWHASSDRALLLVYRGFHPPLLFALGTPQEILALLPEVRHEPEFYVSLRDGLVDHFASAGYQVQDLKTLHRMLFRPDLANLPPAPRAERLSPADFHAITRLFADGDATGERPPFFQQSALSHGVYFGVREKEELVAAAGTLVYAPEEGAACIGNVYTRRDRRGQGLASVVTAAVTRELAGQGIATIALNVRDDNRPAIRIYERLGYTRYCDYQEARLTAIR